MKKLARSIVPLGALLAVICSAFVPSGGLASRNAANDARRSAGFLPIRGQGSWQAGNLVHSKNVGHPEEIPEMKAFASSSKAPPSVASPSSHRRNPEHLEEGEDEKRLQALREVVVSFSPLSALVHTLLLMLLSPNDRWRAN